jgi:ribosomal protein S18 acetylase RimI-like enzyme
MHKKPLPGSAAPEEAQVRSDVGIQHAGTRFGSRIVAEVQMRDGRSAYIARANNRGLGREFDKVVQIEESSFPPSIRDSASYLIKLAESPLQLFLIARIRPSDEIVGYLAAERLELFDDVPGVKEDPNFSLGDSVYLASVAIAEPYRHQGIGITMERACMSLAHRGEFARVTAHVAHDALKRMGLRGHVIRTFPNWYQTGQPYDYIELSLERKGA